MHPIIFNIDQSLGNSKLKYFGSRNIKEAVKFWHRHNGEYISDSKIDMLIEIHDMEKWSKCAEVQIRDIFFKDRQDLLQLFELIDDLQGKKIEQVATGIVMDEEHKQI